ncbi:hypothetical protein BHM03_00047218 [Ensete ventricosum]|nr:hypothetical protein BHM03_00047218 [Ensete ventricosum]
MITRRARSVKRHDELSHFWGRRSANGRWGLELPDRVDLSDGGDARVSMVEKRPSSGAEAGLRKCLRKVAAEQPADTSSSTARTYADKGKGTLELEEVLE